MAGISKEMNRLINQNHTEIICLQSLQARLCALVPPLTGAASKYRLPFMLPSFLPTGSSYCTCCAVLWQ